MTSEHANFLCSHTAQTLWQNLRGTVCLFPFSLGPAGRSPFVPAGSHCQAFLSAVPVGSPSNVTFCLSIGFQRSIFSKHLFHTSSLSSPWFKIVMKQQLTDQQCTFVQYQPSPLEGRIWFILLSIASWSWSLPWRAISLSQVAATPWEQ